MNANQLASEVAARTAITTGNTNNNSSSSNTANDTGNTDVANESMNLSVLGGKHEKIAKHLKSVAASKTDVNDEGSNCGAAGGNNNNGKSGSYEPKQNGQYRESDERLDGRETPFNSWQQREQTKQQQPQHHRVNGEKSATAHGHNSNSSNSNSSSGSGNGKGSGSKRESDAEMSAARKQRQEEEDSDEAAHESAREHAASNNDEGDFERLHTATIIKTPLNKTLLKRCSSYSALGCGSNSGSGNGSGSNGNSSGNGQGYGSANTAATSAYDNAPCCTAVDETALNCSGREEREREQDKQHATAEQTSFNGGDECDSPPHSSSASACGFAHKMPTTPSTAATGSGAVDSNAAKCSKCNNNNNIHYNNYNCYYRKKSRMPICRIMTLSRGPYSELDKMSLFQDLKLKRRKIDSRCSSDGESVADTSTSSPDLLAPMSPKMCDTGGAGAGGGGGHGGGGGGALSSLPLPTAVVTLTATSTIAPVSAAAATICSSSNVPTAASSNSGHNVCAATPPSATTTVVVSAGKAAAIKAEQKHQQQQHQQQQTEINSSSGTVSAAAASSVMSPPPTTTVRMSPAPPTDLSLPAGRRTPSNATPTRATPTPPHNNGNASSSCGTSNGGGSSRASPDSMDERPSTTTTTTTGGTQMSTNGIHGGASGDCMQNAAGAECGVSNLSVIRSVKEERIAHSPTKMLSYHQHQQQQQQQMQYQQHAPSPTQSKGLTQSQQHVSVLVTPSRIKSELSTQQQQHVQQMPPTSLQHHAHHPAYSTSVSTATSSVTSTSGAMTTTTSSSAAALHASTPSPTPLPTPAAVAAAAVAAAAAHHPHLHHPPPPIVQTHHLHQQLTQPQLRKSSPPSGLGLPQQHLLNQSMQHLTQQQQLQLLQQAAAMSQRPTQMSPNAINSSPSARHQTSASSPHQHLLQQHHHHQQQQQQQQQQQHLRIKKEPAQLLAAAAGSLLGSSGGAQRHLHSPHHHHPSSPQQQQQQPPQQLPPQALGNIAQLIHPASLQLRHPNRDAAILFRVKNEVHQQVAAAQLMQPGAAAAAAAAAQRMVWVSNARINGVKPEVIGGPLGGLRPGGPAQSPSPHHSSSSSSSQLSPQTPSQTPPRGTPTVIMGESCGVRTMVWGYEPAPPTAGPSPTHGGNSNSGSGGGLHQTPPSTPQHSHGQQQQQPPSSMSSLSQQSHHSSQSSMQSASSPSAGSITPTHTPGPSPQNNEEAAQLLLSLGQTRIQDVRPRPHQFRTPHALNMERLWAGDYSQLPPGQIHALNLSAQQQWGSTNATGMNRGLDTPHEPTDEDDQPLVCMICEDKATGLHYGIITCEGCKGFFKRTVQNRRVYTCVADGTCEITKAQRNRCQYCRFKKCIEQGMVLQAVREDRMPGGRNSGAVYNLYKVKYKKHKKSKQQQQQQQQQSQQQHMHSPHHQSPLSPHHQQHLLSPQQHLHQHQQQLAAAAAVAAAAQHQHSKLISATLGQSEMKPMFLGPSIKQELLQQQQQQQHQQQQAAQLHSPHQQQLHSPHHTLHGSPHGALPPHSSASALHSPLSHGPPSLPPHTSSSSSSSSSASSGGSSSSSQQPSHHALHSPHHTLAHAHHLQANASHTSPHAQQLHQQQQQQQQQQQHQQHVQASQLQETAIKLPSHLVNGTILKTALTNPSEIVHLRNRLDTAVSSSKDRQLSYEHAHSMIQTLIDCDAMEDIATLPHFSEFLEDKSEISEKLCNIGDSIVHKLVSWTKKLPFYLEIPVDIHTKLLTDKWHEILILTTAAYQALHGRRRTPSTTTPGGGDTTTAQASSTTSSSGGRSSTGAPPHSPASANHHHNHHHMSGSPHATSLNLPHQLHHQQMQTATPPLQKEDPEFVDEVNGHLLTLQTCLTTLMGQPIAMEQLKLDVGHMVDKMTQITIMFRRIKLKMEEYVCLKVYILLNKEVELETIQERYVQVLRTYLQHSSPQNPQDRLTELLSHIPEIQAAASLLLESKMFYVPFVLNSASVR
nr:hormone receptor 4 isoform X2 [Bactrocera oleae]